MYRLCRYVDWVTLTYISCSIDFYTFYVTLPYVLNCKAFNHQTLYSISSRCTDSAGILTWWPWPILCTPVTLTHFMLMFDISSDIRPTTTKPCIVLFLNVRIAGTLTGWPWPIFCTSLTSTLFTSPFHMSSTVRPSTTKSYIMLLLAVLTWQVPWTGSLDLYFAHQWLWHILCWCLVSPQI